MSIRAKRVADLSFGAAVVAGSLACLPVLAADRVWVSQPVQPAGWIVTVTGNAVLAPRYPGADELGFFGYPSVSFRRAGEARRFSTPDEGLSLALYDTPAIRFGVVGRYRGGRYFGDDRRLFGFEDVRWAVEPGVFVEAWPMQFLRARAELRRGFVGHEGFVADLALDAVFPAGATTMSVGPRVTLGDDEFTRTYFGVRPFEAALNGRVPAYRPSGGITSVGALAAVSHDWTAQWSTIVYASYHRLVGDAASSPIVKRFGSEDQFSVGASLSYSFAVAGW